MQMQSGYLNPAFLGTSRGELANVALKLKSEFQEDFWRISNFPKCVQPCIHHVTRHFVRLSQERVPKGVCN